MTTPFLITGYQHSLHFCQAFEREWGREILRSKTPNFAPSTLCFGGLPRGANTKQTKVSRSVLIFQIKQTYCNYRSQSNLLYIIFYISWKSLWDFNFSEFKIWNTIFYCFLLF